MRTLLPVPDSALEPSTHLPRYGSYRGGLARVDLGPLLKSRRARVLRHKRWMYVAIATPDLYVAICIVRLGYAANAFVFAFDGKANRMLVDRSVIAPPFGCHVGDFAAEGCEARIQAAGGTRMLVARPPGSSAYTVEARMKDLAIHARLDTDGAPPPITAIARIGEGLVNTTEKRALLTVTGDAVIGGVRHSLDGALGGYDYTNGILARHTAWRWGFLLGRAKTGERVALNLVQGFVGEAECAAWIDGEVFPLAEGRFAFDAEAPLRPWRMTTEDGVVDFQFEPHGMHAEKKNLGLVSSRFVQPVGVFSGTLAAGGRALEIPRALGVTEDQDVKW